MAWITACASEPTDPSGATTQPPRSDHGKTIVLVLHDLNQACRYAHHLIAMRNGAIVAEGSPAEVVTAPLVESVFGLAVRVIPDPECGAPLVIPRARNTSSAGDHDSTSSA